MTRKPGMLQFLGSQSWTRLSYLTTLTVVKNKSSLFIFLDSVQERSNKTCFHFLNPVLMCKGFPTGPLRYIYTFAFHFSRKAGVELSPLLSCHLKFSPVLASAAHILKLERYREDQHGPCARMTRKFVKRSIFF